MLSVGGRAPALDEEAVRGERVQWPVEGAARPLLVAFARPVESPLGRLALRELRGATALGAQVVAVVPSTRGRILAWLARDPAPFPVVADPRARRPSPPTCWWVPTGVCCTRGSGARGWRGRTSRPSRPRSGGDRACTGVYARAPEVRPRARNVS